MELFFASEIDAGTVRLDGEEARHCIKVLRHREGDPVDCIDGAGTLLHCTLIDADPREAVLRIDSAEEGWGALPYRLTLGVCPTKNTDRFEWAVEKATEFGVESIVPLIGERSERRVFKADRARRVALAATKQSLKALLPSIPEPVPVRDFLAGEIHLTQRSASYGAVGAHGVSGEPISPHLTRQSASESPALPVGVSGEFHEAGALPGGNCPDGDQPAIDALHGGNCPAGDQPATDALPGGNCTAGDDREGRLRLIACCFDGAAWQRVPMSAALESAPGATDITVLIGPEGDFSPEEVEAARSAGYIPVHLGSSRLRTETAAVAAAAFVYYHFL